MFKLGRWLAGMGALIVGLAAVVGGAALSSASVSPPKTSSAVVTAPSPGNGSGLAIQSATVADLAAQGITLQRPSSGAIASQATVVDSALTRFPGSNLREVVLAQVSDTYTMPNVRCTCWVVSLALPAGISSMTSGPPPGTRHTAAYLIMFYDAISGAFVEGIQGGPTG